MDARGAADYFPATSSMLWLEWRIFGNNEPNTPKVNQGIGAPGYHIVNVVLHACCVILLWAVLARLSLPGAWISAFIWGIHPVCVESVAWISELKNTLSMVVFLIMMLMWFRYQRTKDKWDYALTIALFIVALLAKTAIVMAPFVLLLHIWWERGWSMRFEWKQVLYFSILPLLVLLWCAFGVVGHLFWKTQGLIICVMLTTPFLYILGKYIYGKLTDNHLRDALVFSATLLVFTLWSVSGILLCWKWEWTGCAYFLILLTPIFWFALLGIYKKLTFEDLRISVPFFAISFIFGVITWWFQITRAIGQEIVPIGGPIERVAGACFALGFYLYKIILPVNLVLIYPEWHIPPPGHFISHELLLMLPGLAYAAVFYWAWRNRSTWGRHVIFSLGFFVLMLFPILGLVKIAYLRLTLVADHFEYMPMVSVIALCVAGCLYHRKNLRPPMLMVFNVSAIAIMALFCLLTWQRAYAFSDKKNLWLDTLAKNPHSWQAHSHYGAILYNEGDVDGALEHWTRCVELKPYIYEVHNNRGLALMKKGRMDEALEEYKKAVDIDNTQFPVVMNYADGLRIARHFDEAIKQYKRLLELSAENPSPIVYLDMGVSYFEMGRLDDSIDAFESALRIVPQYTAARQDLDRVLQAKQEEMQKKQQEAGKIETGTNSMPVATPAKP
ncbi:MAG: tetratricopeptide repeat protein [Chthoniobacteraceae bacterium]